MWSKSGSNFTLLLQLMELGDLLLYCEFKWVEGKEWDDFLIEFSYDQREFFFDKVKGEFLN